MKYLIFPLLLLTSNLPARVAISGLSPVKRCHQPKYEAGDIPEQFHNPVWLEMSPLLRRDDTSNQATSEVAANREKGVTPLAVSNFKLRPETSGSNYTRAVVVGISEYQSPRLLPLPEARRNAVAAATWLMSPAGGNLSEDQLLLLTDSAATLARLAAALDWLAESVREGDLALVYFAGQRP